MIITCSISALISPDQTSSLMASFNASIPCPLKQQTSTIERSWTRLEVRQLRQFQLHRQIHFVADQNPFLAGELGQIILIRLRQRLAGVEDVQNEFGVGERFAAAADAFLLDLVARLAQAGGVNEHDRQPANVRRLLNRVARRAGNRRDDGAITAEQLVQQTRFARRWAGR